MRKRYIVYIVLGYLSVFGHAYGTAEDCLDCNAGYVIEFPMTPWACGYETKTGLPWLAPGFFCGEK